MTAFDDHRLMMHKISHLQDKRLYVISLTIILSVVFRIWVSSPTWLHFDENYYINIAQNFADRGELTPYMWRIGDANIIAGSGSGYAILILTEWMRLVGESLFWGRMLMVFAGLLTAVVMYKTASIWWDSRIAGIAALLFGLVSTSSFYTLIFRMDSIGILVYSLLLWLHIYAVRKGSDWSHFFLGVGAVFALEFHVLGSLYLVGFAIYYASQSLREAISKRRILVSKAATLFVLGTVLAGVVYVIIHILPDPEAYLVVSRTCYECSERIIETEFKRLIRLLAFRPLDLIIFLVVLLAALVRNKSEDHHFLILLMGWVATMVIIGVPPYTHYTNHGWPLLALGVAGFISKGFDYRESEFRFSVGIILSLVLLFSNLGLYLLKSYPYFYGYERKTTEAVEYIQEQIPQDAVVLARVPSFYSLREFRNFIAYEGGEDYGVKLRGETKTDFWRRESPQVIYLAEGLVNQDKALTAYMNEHEFEHVMRDLWIAKDLMNLRVSQAPHTNLGDK
jgi:hypothetical protein